MNFREIKAKLALGMIGMFSMISVAAATTVTEDLTNFTAIVTNFTAMVTSILSLFLVPPLLYFTVLVIFVAVIGIVKRLMHGGKR